MDSEIKKKLRESLFEEQGHICAYCERKINLQKSKIEHHCEQSICNGNGNTTDRRLDYTNLLLVCTGNENSTGEATCDTMKSQFSQQNYLPINFSPTNRHHCGTIEYNSTGNIRSNLYQDEIDKVLNLNAEHLKEDRKRVWNSLFMRCISEAGLNKIKLKRITKQLLQRALHFESAYPGMYAYINNIVA